MSWALWDIQIMLLDEEDCSGVVSSYWAISSYQCMLPSDASLDKEAQVLLRFYSDLSNISAA